MHLLIQNKIKPPILFGIPALFILVYVLISYESFEDRFDSAERNYTMWEMAKCTEICKSLLKESPDDPALLELYGKALLASGELVKAKNIFSDLILKNSNNIVSHKFDLAFTYFYLGSLDSSSLLVNQILEPVKPGEEPELMSQCLNLLGLIAFNKAQYKIAMYYQEESLKLARKAKSLDAEANALRQIGVLYWYDGKIDSVIQKYYEPALFLYRVTGNKKGEATTLSNIGLINGTLENWVEKTRYQLQAMALRKKINDQMGIADCYYFLTQSIPYTENGRSFDFSYYKKSFELSSKIGYAWGREVALRGLIDIQAGAVNDFNFPDYDTTLISSVEGKIQRTLRKAAQYFESGQLSLAEKEYKNGIYMCDSLGYNSALVAALVLYADVLTLSGKYNDAQKVIDRILNITSKSTTSETNNESLYRKAALLYEMKKEKEAVKIFSKLIEYYDSQYTGYLNSLSPSLAFETAASKVHYMRSRVYDGYFKSLIRLRKYEEAFEIIEKERRLPFWGERDYEESNESNQENNLLSELINYMEALDKNDFEGLQEVQTKIGEIYQSLLTRKDAYKEASVSFLKNVFYNVKDIIKILRPGEVLLEYFVDKENVYVFVLNSSGLKVIGQKIKSDELASVVDIFNETILRGKDFPEDKLWKKPSEYLYSLIIKPLRSKNLIKPGDHLFISPHHVMHYIPFQALLNNESGKFLIEDYTLTYLPSANYIVNRHKRITKEPGSIIAVAPDANTLPFSKNEITELQNFPNSKFLKLENSDATAIRFLREAGNFDLIHVAAHGKVNKRYPLYSSIRFTDKKIELHEIIKLNLKARLAFLSACEAGVNIGKLGIFPSGHDMVSFPRAFITAGAASVISPLWLIEDETTSELVMYFYNFISSGKLNGLPDYFSKALSEAQKKLINSHRKSGKKNHPFYWAAFFISGEG